MKETIKNKVGKPLKYKSPAVLDRKVTEWIVLHEDSDNIFLVTDLAIYLDLSRRQLIEYGERPEYHNSIKKAKSYCENYAEKHLFGNHQATGAIFNLKNNYGWVDTQQHINVNLNATIDESERDRLNQLLKPKLTS